MREIASLSKGLEILSAFDLETEGLSAQAISQRLQLPISTTYRYLQTLEREGFLLKNADAKSYELGFMVFQMGNIVALQMKLVDIVLPHMKSLASLSGETVLLTIISGWKALCIESVETRRLIKLSLERGSSLPLYAGAPSKILLAHQTEAFIGSFLGRIPLVKFTPNTPTDPLVLKKELKEIRKQGFAFTSQEVDLGASAIAAPVFDRRGKTIAGLSVAGPMDRISVENIPRLMQVLKESTSQASFDLAQGSLTV